MALADDFKKLSPKVKAVLIGALFLFAGVADWLYLLQPSLEKRAVVKTKLTELEEKVAERERITAQKERFVKEVALLREAFRLALTKLPDQREIPGLFQAVSVAGREAGMDFLLFEPKASAKPADTKAPDVKANLKPSDQRAEQKPDAKGTPAKSADPGRFYDEIPVSVKVKGAFNNIVFFFDKVAKLPRIVNIQDISMGQGKNGAGKAWNIETSCIIKTYMFSEKKEEPARNPNEKAK